MNGGKRRIGSLGSTFHSLELKWSHPMTLFCFYFKYWVGCVCCFPSSASSCSLSSFIGAYFKRRFLISGPGGFAWSRWLLLTLLTFKVNGIAFQLAIWLIMYAVFTLLFLFPSVSVRKCSLSLSLSTLSLYFLVLHRWSIDRLAADELNRNAVHPFRPGPEVAAVKYSPPPPPLLLLLLVIVGCFLFIYWVIKSYGGGVIVFAGFSSQLLRNLMACRRNGNEIGRFVADWFGPLRPEFPHWKCDAIRAKESIRIDTKRGSKIS